MFKKIVDADVRPFVPVDPMHNLKSKPINEEFAIQVTGTGAFNLFVMGTMEPGLQPINLHEDPITTNGIHTFARVASQIRIFWAGNDGEMNVWLSE